MEQRSASRLLIFAAAAAAMLLPISACPASAQTTGSMPDMHWRMIGPFRGGRTRAAAGVPDQPNVFYIGQVDGGVWKSTDYGRTWNPIFDQQDTQSIGAIAVAPSDSSVVYVASGEGLHRPDLSVGDGIYRSSDAGKTWTHLGLRDGEQIPALAVDPQNPDRLFAAVLGHPYGANAERGIFRSEDGGKTWKKVLYKDDRTGGSDVVIDPQNPQIVYASLWEETLGPWEDANSYAGTHGGLFKSTDGGATWKPLTSGLPDNPVQINVAIAASHPQRLYATVATKAEGGYASDKGLGVYRSDDAGATWQRITDDPRPAMKIGGGDLPVPVVDPKNPEIVYSTSIVTCRSTDGGKTWISLRGAPGGDDYQNLWINPHNPQILLLVSDQGAVVSVNGGESWSSWYVEPTAQLYHVAATNTFPYQVCAGQQESGSVCTSTRGNDGEITFRDWHPVGIIEYGYAAPDPLHPEIVYGAGRTEVSRYDMVTGQVQNITPLPMHRRDFRADRTEPILFSPVDPHTMYYAANHLFKTTDYGHTWQTISPDLSREKTTQPASLPALSTEQQAQRRGVIYSVAASYKNTQTIWAGTDDGLVWITRDGGANWTSITPPGVSDWSKIAQIDASRFDDDTAYVAVSRMRVDDLRPYIYRTHDGGKSWQTIGAGLPEDAPVNAVRADPVQPGLLYAATEHAVWASFDDGAHWQPLQYNLPHTSMRDLLVKDDDLIVATHGRSFWVLDDVSPLRELAADAGRQAALLLSPAPAWRVQRDTNTDTPLPADEPAGENPPDGAILDYDLPGDAHEVALEMLDGTGQVLRRYSSSDPVAPSPEGLRTNLIPAYWPAVHGPLPITAGMHRVVWDLHATAPTAVHYEYPIAAVPHRTPLTPEGPLVLPGTYTIRLTVDGHSESKPLLVKMDPRVHTSVVDLEALHTEQTAMAASLDALAKADLAAHSVSEQIAAPQNAALSTQLAPFSDTLKTLLDGTGPKAAKRLPGIDEVTQEATQLYEELQQADAAPTEALKAAAAHVEMEGKEVLPGWEEFEQKQLPALNTVLRNAHHTAVDPAKQPENIPEEGDEG
ncbi:WD40/YVTN/BNR-like repeat-containing protein [Paracidobacterium acidisoli]|uniref:Glycoside hydrolase n=1 Tax=Paracidobacterium acidisoli TaxID=2303751 RepID=A0A372IJD7_9BACT|nr:glycoside hydrolase [Paracidobacterium acidisoli]MBT9333238.1 glycoside hydrolase [Paracidobacterium acidisoli]